MDKKEALLRLKIKIEDAQEEIEKEKVPGEIAWSRGRLYGLMEAMEIVKNITRASRNL